MSTKSTSRNGGIGFFGLLTIVFITLKLCDIIHWSWWWVLAPSLVPLVILLLILLGALILLGIVTCLKHYSK